MKLTFTSILLLSTLFSFSQNCSDCRYADSLELVKLYNATDGVNWTNKWNLSQPMDTWYSGSSLLVNGRVTNIDLQQNGLNGTIPDLNLPKLQELILDDAGLTGTLPFFNLPALQMLFINNSNVSGNLLNFNLPNLQNLSIGSCPLLTGTIPAFNNLPNLKQLSIIGTQLSGNIPNFSQNLTSLVLTGNKLSGSIPNFNMPDLTTLDVGSNLLTGSIPNFNLPKLQYLTVAANQLSGAIPELHLPALLSLNATYNQLSGALPSFNYLPSLNVLVLSNNQLSGAAPTFGSKSPLYTIDLGNNQLTGSLPAYNLSFLVNLFFNNNQLTGTIPSFQLPKLEGLLLNDNQLSGPILGFSMPALTGLDLSSNQLTGSIPNFTLPELKHLHLNSNQLSGSIPAFNLPYLESLLLNDNQLTGCIPGAIKTNSPGIQNGNISNNTGLATQSWSDYWDKGAGACQPSPTSSVLTADVSSLCNGSATALRVTITGGNSPYSVVYSINKTRFTITNYVSGSDIPVSPTTTTTYELVSVTDATSQASAGITGKPTITVNQPTMWYLDADRDGYYINSVLSCLSPGEGYSNRLTPAPGDCNDNDAAIHPNATEICDGVDNNCDGQIDEGFPDITYHRDSDGDGYGDPNNTFIAKCNQPTGYVTNNGDCDDNNAAIHPGATEICDGIDNNCDGQIDEGFPDITYYRDADGDGYGDPNNTTVTKCNPPAGYVTNNADCNDNNAAIHPGATEICDGIDNNCDGQIDEGFPDITYYRDADGDGYGDPNNTVVAKCNQPAGYVTNYADCNDNNSAVHPNATEICDGIDNDCDGQVDEGFPDITYYRDADGDGYGDPNNTAVAKCNQPAGYVTNNADCNDKKATIHAKTFYRDADGDGYGNASDFVIACIKPIGYVSNKGDCDDTNPSRHWGCNATPVVSIAVNKSIKEGSKIKIVNFQVNLNKISTQVVSVNFATQDGTATAFNDYLPSNTTITFPPGSKQVVATITIIGDKIVEPDETFYVHLSNPVNATINNSIATATIKNDDGIAALTSQDENVDSKAKDLRTIRNVLITPNPASSKVTVSLINYTGNVIIHLSDMQGRLLQEKKIQLLKSKSNQISLDVTKYASGFYLLTVFDDKGNYKTFKLLVTR